MVAGLRRIRALTLLAARFVSEENIVLVGVNHRLNVFGYTYLGDLNPKYANSGNVGQLDLVMSLKWVRDNITNFGGDPSNVTCRSYSTYSGESKRARGQTVQRDNSSVPARVHVEDQVEVGLSGHVVRAFLLLVFRSTRPADGFTCEVEARTTSAGVRI
jgi:hypothetical protein